MKKIFIGIFLLVPFLSYADLLMKIGVLDMDKITEEYPAAKGLKETWDSILSKKYFMLEIYEKEQSYLENIDKKIYSLSERNNIEIKIQYLKKEINNLKNSKKKDWDELQNTKGKDVKKKILLAIREARKKKGFGVILSSKEKFILYYSDNMNFTKYVLEELMPDDKKKK